MSIMDTCDSPIAVRYIEISPFIIKVCDIVLTFINKLKLMIP